MGKLIGLDQARSSRAGTTQGQNYTPVEDFPEEQWSFGAGEPYLGELLDDPTIGLLMRRDQVARADLVALIAKVSRRIERCRASAC